MAAALYCCALPLWEGWDEPFHYGYVECLAAWDQFPILGKTTIPADDRQSLTFTPLPRFLSDSVPGSVPFEKWTHMDDSSKRRLRAQLYTIPSSARLQSSASPNYEAQQTPLAYFLLAPLDSALATASIPTRVIALRLLGAFCAVVWIYLGLSQWLDTLGLHGAFRLAALFCAMISQMLWASIAHVGNDWLAIALTVWFLALVARIANDAPQNVVPLAVVFSLGLITKAYFLAFTPVFVAFIIRGWARASVPWKTAATALSLPFVIAGPWYLRNQLLYGSFSGTQETVNGVTLIACSRRHPAY